MLLGTRLPHLAQLVQPKARQTQRTSDAKSKPLPQQRAFREYGHADRTHSEKCDRAGTSLQPRVDRVQPSERQCPRGTPACALGSFAASVSRRPTGVRKHQLQGNRPEAAADSWICWAAFYERRIRIPRREAQSDTVHL